MKNNFTQRSITGTLFVATVTAATLFHEFSFFALLFVINFMCLLEFYELVLPDKSWIEKYLGIICGSIIFIMFAMIFSADLSLAWYYNLIPIFLLMFIIKLFEKSHNEFSTLAFQILGILYITMPLVLLTKMGFFNQLNYSYGLPMGFFILLWTSDTGAYLAGKTFGKTKLFERISPKKTWEGSIGGVILSLLVAFGISKFLNFDDATTKDWMVIGVLVVIFGTLGDLFESLLKRNLNIKDSGNILPGHGGVLDRFDGLFLSVPAVYFYLLLTN
ncbi:MAG: phosphatidate cytidylyltransferase [Bacteroidia bacterium]|nr:phosphatidate cytidylyltransferase [Bacteroidia bacterium]MCC7534365.1 phosphatidate cytidylyltransferase [Bacteroidia bacterium]MCZ2140425.1 phosphatidate cytidylyltransferase [Bacteroidia bacterium]